MSRIAFPPQMHQPNSLVSSVQPKIAIKNNSIAVPSQTGRPVVNNINNNDRHQASQMRPWVDLVDESSDIGDQLNTQPKKKLIIKNDISNVNDNQVNSALPELDFINNQVDAPLPQKRAGSHPGPDLYKLERDIIVNNDDYVLVINPPYQGKNKPAEPVFQQRDADGLFYNSVGDCLQTSRTGRILVFRTKKGEHRYATWPKPKADLNPKVSLRINEVKEFLRSYDRKHSLTTIRNPAFKSGKKGEPALITVDQKKSRIDPENHPEYFKYIEELRQLTHQLRQSDVNSENNQNILSSSQQQEKENKDGD
jgi:hypothetical protein